MNIKKIIKRYLPLYIVDIIRIIIHPQLFKETYYIYKLKWCYQRCIRRIKKQEKVNIAFYVWFDSTWKCDELYKLFLSSANYNPYIVVCPVINYGKENMLYQMKKTKAYFEDKDYKVIITYNEKLNSYIDVEKELCPDIIFYTSPYNELTHEKYRIYNIKNSLTCYIPYFYLASKDPMFFDLGFHNMLWAYFIESPYHLDFFKQFGKKTHNCIPVGYAVFDEFELIMSKYKKDEKGHLKTILWAPHHTINENSNLKQSGFLELANYFVKISKEYSNSLRIIFRPHPLLKQNLYLHKDWGKEKTDEYYNFWQTTQNGELSDGGNYIYDFLKSDILIHDCGSFMSEYLYTLKPAIYYSREKQYYPQLNDIGKEAFNAHYVAYTPTDIENIVLTLIEGYDPKYSERKIFKYKYLKFNDLNISKRIFAYLNSKLDK